MAGTARAREAGCGPRDYGAHPSLLFPLSLVPVTPSRPFPCATWRALRSSVRLWVLLGGEYYGMQYQAEVGTVLHARQGRRARLLEGT